MSYSIQYGGKKVYETKQDRRNVPLMVGGAMLFLALAVALLFPQVTQGLRLALCPWLNETTVAAMDGMLHSLWSGADPVEALTAFCREVIHGGAV